MGLYLQNVHGLNLAWHSTFIINSITASHKLYQVKLGCCRDSSTLDTSLTTSTCFHLILIQCRSSDTSISEFAEEINIDKGENNPSELSTPSSSLKVRFSRSHQ